MSRESVCWSEACVMLAMLVAVVLFGVVAARAEVMEGEWYYEGETPYEGELPPEGEGEPPFQSHPADSNGDGRMTMSEAIGYLACWQQGSCSMSYAIRAAYLWQNGEWYAYDAGEEPPMCWELPAPAEGEVMYSLMLGLGAVSPEYIHGSITPDPEPGELCPPVAGQPWCGLYPEGTEVTLTPVPYPGYAFHHWTGDLSGSQVPALVVINADKHVIAEFVALGEGEIPVEGEPVVVPGELVDVPAGTFQMGDPWYEGSSYEVPVHGVYLDAYRIGKYEVTNQEYADVLNWAQGRGYLKNSSGGTYTGGLIYAYNQPIADTQASYDYSQITYSGGVFGVRSRTGHGGVLYSMADHPMTDVSWYGAVCYCNWLSEKNGLQACYDTSNWTRYAPVRNGYRLPTEAEWERAAAWDGSRHWRYGMTSDTIDFTRANYSDWESEDYANPLGLDWPYTSPVGWYNGVNPARVSAPGTLTVNATSPVGAYDMSGNVWEWCHDWWYRVYTTEPVTNPTGPSTGSFRVLRGGSWYNYSRGTRSAARGRLYPGDWVNYGDLYGFRVAVSVSSR